MSQQGPVKSMPAYIVGGCFGMTGTPKEGVPSVSCADCGCADLQCDLILDASQFEKRAATCRWIDCRSNVEEIGEAHGFWVSLVFYVRAGRPFDGETSIGTLTEVTIWHGVRNTGYERFGRRIGQTAQHDRGVESTRQIVED